jgi:hypothetical protein
MFQLITPHIPSLPARIYCRLQNPNYFPEFTHIRFADTHAQKPVFGKNISIF